MQDRATRFVVDTNALWWHLKTPNVFHPPPTRFFDWLRLAMQLS